MNKKELRADSLDLIKEYKRLIQEDKKRGIKGLIERKNMWASIGEEWKTEIRKGK